MMNGGKDPLSAITMWVPARSWRARDIPTHGAACQATDAVRAPAAEELTIDAQSWARSMPAAGNRTSLLAEGPAAVVVGSWPIEPRPHHCIS